MSAGISKRWSLIVAGFIINICLGTIYAWSVFKAPIKATPYSLTEADSVLPFSVFLLTFGVTFAFSGRMISRSGPRKPALIGALLLGVGYLLCYTIAISPVNALWITIVSFGLIAGTGCGFAYNPPIATVGRWFPDKRGLAAGLTVMGFGLSAVLTAPLVTALISSIGLPNTFLVLGIVFLILLSVLGMSMRFPPPDWKAPVSAKSLAPKPWCPSITEYSTKQMTRTSTFYITWFIFLFGAGAGLMIIGNAKQIAQVMTGLTGGLDWLAVLTVQVLSLSNAVGRPAFGSLCDRIGPRNTLLLMQGIQLLCLVIILPLSGSVFALYLSVILFGLTFGAYLAVMPALACYFFGTQNLGPNYGLYLSAYGVGGVVCPLLMGIILGAQPSSGNYIEGFYATAILIVIAIILSFIMRTPKPPKTE